MDNLWYLALAYGVIWVVLLVYLYSIARRQEALHKEMKGIEEALEAGLGAEEEEEEAEPFVTLVRGEGARAAGEGLPDS